MSKLNELNFSEEELRQKLELSDSEINQDNFIIDPILKQRYLYGKVIHIVNGEIDVNSCLWGLYNTKIYSSNNLALPNFQL